MEKGSTLKQIALFVGGVVFVALLVILIKAFGKPGGDSSYVAQNNTTTKPVVSDIPTDNVKGAQKELPQEPNLDKKENQKMTVEQKIAVKAPVEMIDASKNYTATLKIYTGDISLGDIVIELNVKNRPQTVNNFVYLARLGFYDDVIFHRVIDGFMIQGGDPLGTGIGGPAYKFADELTAPNSNSKGTIAMANSGLNTNGSQFFINLVDNNYLDTKHTVFGKVTSGMDVVEKIGKTPVDQNDRPLTPMVINSVEIVED